MAYFQLNEAQIQLLQKAIDRIDRFLAKWESPSNPNQSCAGVPPPIAPPIPGIVATVPEHHSPVGASPPIIPVLSIPDKLNPKSEVPICIEDEKKVDVVPIEVVICENDLVEGDSRPVLEGKGSMSAISICCINEPFKSPQGQLELRFVQKIFTLPNYVNTCFEQNKKFVDTGWNPAERGGWPAGFLRSTESHKGFAPLVYFIPVTLVFRFNVCEVEIGTRRPLINLQMIHDSSAGAEHMCSHIPHVLKSCVINSAAKLSMDGEEEILGCLGLWEFVSLAKSDRGCCSHWACGFSFLNTCFEQKGKFADTGWNGSWKIFGKIVNDNLPIVDSQKPFSHGKYLICSGGGERCKSMNHHLWSFMCALGIAQYFNRTLVMDLSLCLSSIYTSSNQDEEGKDFSWEVLRHGMTIDINEKSQVQAIPEILGCVCEEISHHELVHAEGNSILSAVVQNINLVVHSLEVCIATIKTLFALDFARTSFNNELEQNYVMKMVCETSSAKEIEISQAAAKTPSKSFFLCTSIDLKRMYAENCRNVIPASSHSVNYLAPRYYEYLSAFSGIGVESNSSGYRFMIVSLYGYVVLLNSVDQEAYIVGLRYEIAWRDAMYAQIYLAGAIGPHPLLDPCLNKLGKLPRMIHLNFIRDVMRHLNNLAACKSNSSTKEKHTNSLTRSEHQRCWIVAFKVMRSNLYVLYVELHDFVIQLYHLILEYHPIRDQREVLAEAMKIILCEDRQHDMQKIAVFIKRLATFSLCSGCAESMATLATLKHLVKRNVKCRNLLENEAGDGSVSGSIAEYIPYAKNPNLSSADASLLWEFFEMMETIEMQPNNVTVVKDGEVDVCFYSTVIAPMLLEVVFTQRRKLNWLTSHLTKMWHYVDQAASERIRASLEPALDQYRPVVLSSLKFSKLTLGTIASQFKGVSIIEDDESNDITMELKMNDIFTELKNTDLKPDGQIFLGALSACRFEQNETLKHHAHVKSDLWPLGILVTGDEIMKQEKKEMLAAYFAEHANQGALKNDHDVFIAVIDTKASVLGGEEGTDATVKGITIANFYVSAHGKELLMNASVKLSHDKRDGLVEHNEMGRSTLFKLLGSNTDTLSTNIRLLILEDKDVGGGEVLLQELMSLSQFFIIVGSSMSFVGSSMLFGLVFLDLLCNQAPYSSN